MHIIITLLQCNNPLTKEPKLTSAVRIAPEWTSYDTEIKQLQDRVAASNTKEDDDTHWDGMYMYAHQYQFYVMYLITLEHDDTDIRNHMRLHEDL